MKVWKRLQHVGKRAAKFEFVLSYHDLCVECTKSKWYPVKLCVNWTRRSRNIRTKSHDWNPTLEDSNVGHVDWKLPENVTSKITLYKEARMTEFEDKDWTFIVESVDKHGKRKTIATTKMNMKHYATITTCPRQVDLELKPQSDKYKRVTLSFTLSCTLVKEGMATDDDMMSMASLMSFSGASGALDDGADVANMKDFEGMETPVSSFSSFTAQMGQFLAGPVDERRKLEMAEGDGDDFSTPGDTEDFVRKPMYIGTPPSTPPEDRKCPRPITPPSHDYGDQQCQVNPDSSLHTSSPLKDPVPCESSGFTDLLGWAKDLTKKYKGVVLTNYTTSWRSGMAFCAIIHHYHPDLINFEDLNPRNYKENNKIAFDAGASLGITRVIEPADMEVMKVPDKLQVMTYLHELWTHFTGLELPSASSVNVPRHGRLTASEIMTGAVPYLQHKSAMREYSGTDIHRLLPTRCTDEEMTILQYKARITPERQIELVPDPVEQHHELKKSPPQQAIQPTRDHPSEISNEVPKQRTMTEKELKNPFDSDESDGDDPYAAELSKALEQPCLSQPPIAPITPPPKPPRQRVIPEEHSNVAAAQESNLQSEILDVSKQADSLDHENHHVKHVSHKEELRTRARLLIEKEKSKRADKESTPPTTDTRHHALQSRAQKILEQFKKSQTMKHKSIGERFDKFGHKANKSCAQTESFGDVLPDSSAVSVEFHTSHHVATSCSSSASNATQKDLTDTDIGSTTTVTIKPRPQKQQTGCQKDLLDASEYVCYELAELEVEQADIDKKATKLEVQLRRAMHYGESKKEQMLMQQWFMLVNRKNALIRRQEELNILEKEEDLNKRCEMLNRELRYLMQLEDWEKDSFQKQKEQLLLDELIVVVNKRNQLVEALDEQQISLDQDDATETELRNTSFQKDEKQCLIQ